MRRFVGRHLAGAGAESDGLGGAAVDRDRQGRGAGSAACGDDVVEQAGRVVGAVGEADAALRTDHEVDVGIERRNLDAVAASVGCQRDLAAGDAGVVSAVAKLSLRSATISSRSLWGRG